ncbi:MAG: NADH-quinone oxidoreductase subunit M [Phycisphaerales bacterium]|nr:MAG: NADH-quinone oxidoreductase subunit M [Phycisphaerales bacterium]
MSESILHVLILLPIATAAFIVARPAGEAKTVALWGSLISLVLGVVAAFQFDWSNAGAMQPEVSLVPWLPALGLSISVGADGVSMMLVLLTLLLGPICVAASFSSIKHRVKTYYAWLTILQAAMVGVFIARDILLFYVCFEFTLIPMFVLISIYGSSNRKAAATKFFLYTFTGSILALAGLVYVIWFNAMRVPVEAFAGAGEWSFQIDTLRQAAVRMSPTEQGWVFAAMLLGFAVKVPLFPVHTWLPLAHTEAPTAGSVILAGVLLKLGTYGLYRFAIPFTPIAAVDFAPFIGVLAVIGIIFAGLVCWVQDDVKKLVAYSSVSHLGFCVLGLFALNTMGQSGSVMYMINHGLSTGGLFLLIGMVYERYHTRSMRELGGLASKMPVWSFFMVFFVMASVGLPGLNGFVSEFMCLMGTFQSSDMLAGSSIGATPGVLGPVFAILAGTGVVIGAMYLLMMTGKMVWGPLREPKGHAHHDNHSELPDDLNAREIAVLTPLAVLCLVLGLFPTPVLKGIEAPVNDTVRWVQEHGGLRLYRDPAPARVTELAPAGVVLPELAAPAAGGER